MPHNTNAECAARLAAAGLFVFPVKAATRRPMFQGWRQRSSNDATVVAQWWQQYPNALPALDLAKCGLMALDGDRHGQGDGVAALRDLVRQQPGFDPRRVPTVRTPRDGVHLYFKQGSPPFGNHRGSLPAGVDAKGAGGFVLAPGAKLPDGRGYHGVAGQPELADAVLAGNLPELPPGIAGLIRSAHGRPRRRREIAAAQDRQAHASAPMPRLRCVASPVSSPKLPRAHATTSSTGRPSCSAPWLRAAG
jgi:hypothetical protein